MVLHESSTSSHALSCPLSRQRLDSSWHALECASVIRVEQNTAIWCFRVEGVDTHKYLVLLHSHDSATGTGEKDDLALAVELFRYVS